MSKPRDVLQLIQLVEPNNSPLKLREIIIQINVESPSISWIDRTFVQIGAILKKHHENHTLSTGTSWILWTKNPKYGTVWTLKHAVEAV
jgi:hypothetical protein